MPWSVVIFHSRIKIPRNSTKRSSKPSTSCQHSYLKMAKIWYHVYWILTQLRDIPSMTSEDILGSPYMSIKHHTHRQSSFIKRLFRLIRRLLGWFRKIITLTQLKPKLKSKETDSIIQRLLTIFFLKGKKELVSSVSNTMKMLGNSYNVRRLTRTNKTRQMAQQLQIK